MIYRLRVPRPPLSFFVENLWFYQDLAVDHTGENSCLTRPWNLSSTSARAPRSCTTARNRPAMPASPLLDQRHQRRYIVIGARTQLLDDGGSRPHRRSCTVPWLPNL